MRTSEEYLEDLRAMKPNVYMGGEIVRRDDPRIVPGINVMRLKVKREAVIGEDLNVLSDRIKAFFIKEGMPPIGIMLCPRFVQTAGEPCS